MYQLILDNNSWYPKNTKRYMVVRINKDENLNEVVYRLINMYIFKEYEKYLLPRCNSSFWIYQRNWWNFFYFVTDTNCIIKEMSKPLWYVIKKYNLGVTNTIELEVKTRNANVLNERITRDEFVNMNNYHKIVSDILIQHLPKEMIYHICDYVY